MQTKSGKTVFPIGIGTWNVASTFNTNDPTAKYKGVEPSYGNEAAEIEALRYALAKGQNHIDCAELYGGFYTDEVVGRAIAGLPREDLFIADKLWKTSVGVGLVRPTVEVMLRKLGTDYLDMLYIHAPWSGVAWQAAIPQIDQLIDEGIVGSFAVSNFSIANMQEAARLARHPVTANQMNYNVLHKAEVDEKFKQYCQDNAIQIVAYQPVKRQAVLVDDTVQAVATAHRVTPAQIALAWLLAQGALPIPKATARQHIDENVAAVNIELNAEDMAALNALEDA
jgi:diketogulonate reductase-like aldo/keto reductase